MCILRFCFIAGRADDSAAAGGADERLNAVASGRSVRYVYREYVACRTDVVRARAGAQQAKHSEHLLLVGPCVHPLPQFRSDRTAARANSGLAGYRHPEPQGWRSMKSE